MNEMDQMQNVKKVSRTWIALHSKKIERLAIQYGRNAENAASVAEETCRRIYFEKTFIQHEDELLPTLYQIAISILLENEEVEDTNLLPFEEDYELHQLIIQLNSQLKLPIILSEFHWFNEEEITEILGKSTKEINHLIGEAHLLLGIGMDALILKKRLDFLQRSYSRIQSNIDIEQVFQVKQIKNKIVQYKSLKKRLPVWVAAVFAILTLCTVLVVSSEEFQQASAERYFESLPELFEKELSSKLHKLGITHISEEQQNNYRFYYISNARDRFTDFLRILEQDQTNGRKITKTEIRQQYEDVLLNLQLPSEMLDSLIQNPLTNDKMKSEEFMKKLYEQYSSISGLYAVEIRSYSQYLGNETVQNYRIDIQQLLTKMDTFPEEFQVLLDGMLKQNLELFLFQDGEDYYTSFKKSKFSESLRQNLYEDVGGYVTLIEYEPFNLINGLVYSLKESVNFIQEFEKTLFETNPVTSPYPYLRGIYARLLHEVIIGSDPEKIFDSDGVVKDEVQSAWKAIAAYEGNSPSAFIMREIIREMEANEWKSSKKYDDLDIEQFHEALELAKDGNLNDLIWKEQSFRYDRKVATFDDQYFHLVIEKLYENFSKEYDYSILDEALSLEVFAVYDYANQLEDPVTMWHLLDHDQIPYSLEEFIEDWQPHLPIKEVADQLFAELQGDYDGELPLITIGYQAGNATTYFARMKPNIEKAVWLVYDVPILR